MAGTRFISERDRLMECDVILDGHVAHISGRLEPDATVWYMRFPGDISTLVCAHFAWATVQHIIDDCGGAFSL